jgi:hypothetical protein
LLSFAIVVVMVIPWLISDGMFMDGQQYACVAKNMAAGKGSFWFPVFTEIGVGGYSTFHEQAPLMFGLQALFFKVFGGGFLTERVYGFVMLALTTFLIIVISKMLKKKGLVDISFGFLPVLLWIIVPVVHWSFANNVVEITMGVFILLSFVFLLKGILAERNQILWLILGGVNIFLASFTKGLPGIFTISIPFWFWLIYNKDSFVKMLVQTLVPIFIVAVCYGLVLLIPEARESLYIHWVTRVFGRIKSDPVVSHRTAVVLSLMTELLPIYLPVLFAMLVLSFKKNISLLKKNCKLSLFLFLIGLSGSLPLMITLVQRNFYYLGAIPFFALAASVLITPLIIKIFESIDFKKVQKGFNLMAVLVFCASLVFSITFYRKPLRDKEILQDVYTIGEKLGENSKIRSSGKIIFNDWSFRCYLLRYYDIELVNYPPADYHLYYKDDVIKLNNLRLVDCELNVYNLYEEN